jgi:hypothetical protein
VADHFLEGLEQGMDASDFLGDCKQARAFGLFFLRQILG